MLFREMMKSDYCEVIMKKCELYEEIAELRRNFIIYKSAVNAVISEQRERVAKLESQASALDKKHGVDGCFDRNTVGWIGEFKTRIEELEAAIVALQLKLDSLNLKVDYPVEKPSSKDIHKIANDHASR